MIEIEMSGPVAANLGLFILAIAGPLFLGYAVSRRFRGVLFAGERLLIGSTFGLAVFTTLCFLASLAIGFRSLTIAVTVVSCSLAGLAILSKEPASHKAKRAKSIGAVDRVGLAVFVTAVCFFTYVCNRLILWQDGALATGYLDAWGDLPFHTSLIFSFLKNTNLSFLNPIFAGQPLVYPFMSDFFSASLMRLGISLEFAVEWPAILFNSFTMTFLYYLSYRLVKRKAAAALVPALLILGGGLGFFWFLQDVFFAPQPIWEFLQHLPQRYTNLPELNIHWINPTLAHLLPQRSFLFGFPIAFAVLTFFWRTYRYGATSQPHWPAILMGLLPLFHTHTFATLAIVAATLAFITCLPKTNRRRYVIYWLRFGLISGLIAAPQILYILNSNISHSVLRFQPGWLLEGGNILWFWLKNLGVFIPLVLLALFFRRRLRVPKSSIMFYLPFVVVFVIANLFLFAPMAYDNNKMLIFWFIMSAPFVARLLIALYESQSWWLHAFAFRFLFGSLVCSGMLNLAHEFQNGGWPELTAEEVSLASQIRKQVEPEAVFLTAPVHNNLLSLTGHQIVLGYPGHVYSHGRDHTRVESDVEKMFSGSAEAIDLLEKYGVDYIVVGPQERRKYGEELAWLAEGATSANGFTSDNYVIYDVDSMQLTGSNDNLSLRGSGR